MVWQIKGNLTETIKHYLLIEPTNLYRKPEKRPKKKTPKTMCKWGVLQGSSSPVCPVVLRTHGGECLPSAMSDSEH